MAYNIAVIPGDGTGPEMVREGLKVLKAIGERYALKLNFINYDLGGDRYLRTGETLPDSVLAELKQCDAILLG
ncbi:MAG TPA: 3-isopropylmalate dehydrogenase, partial [Firmicutes bacterium]|nr:3-isopropylmalate dehydrogenase [Bacillota bacterium]